MEKKRFIIAIILSWFVGILCSFFFGIYMKRENQRWFYYMTDSVLREIEKEYPEAEEKVIQRILHEGITSSNQSVLQKYGVDETEFCMKFDDCVIHVSPVVGMVGIFLLFSCGILLVFVRFWKRQNQQMESLGQYCEDVLQEQATLQLRDNDEGTFSIVKNKVYDITVLLREKNQLLEKNKKETERLLEDISHQLKTPITSLHMINEILYMDLPEEKRMKFLDNMQADLLKIEWFVKTMLNLAKLDSNTLQLKKEIVAASVLAKEIVDYFQIFCEVSGSSIESQGDKEIQIFCDKKWLLEALHNIVKNAIEHGAKCISLSWSDNALYTKLEIADDGEGIAKEEIFHIFERFYRTKGSREDSMGLGMAFTKRMIEYQDGEVKVKSKLGEGTTFIVKLYKNYVPKSL